MGRWSAYGLPLPQAIMDLAVGPPAGGSAADSGTSPTKRRGITLVAAISIYTDTRKRKIHLNFHTADWIVPTPLYSCHLDFVSPSGMVSFESVI